ncbi:MAG: 3-oxoacyl-[acyl-carrier protein] reductase [Flammeovirgaceae bacterium]|jgi:3-oxoacyl-[acyl-carrier protein] reductase
MNLDLSGKNAVVCGSSQGIGKAIAIELAELGANVILLARNQARLDSVLELLDTSENQEHSILLADFSEPEQVKTVLEDFIQRNHTIHILVNNTGGPSAGLAIDAETDQFIEAFQQHLICNQYLVQAVVPTMKVVNYGRIINIISSSVKAPIPNLGVSNTIRGAVASWGKTLANELGQFGITVNNVLPGLTQTARLQSLIETIAKQNEKTPEEQAEIMKQTIPAQRFADAHEIAKAVAFLASPSASYINGVNLPVDGGRLPTL